MCIPSMYIHVTWFINLNINGGHKEEIKLSSIKVTNFIRVANKGAQKSCQGKKLKTGSNLL